MPIESISISRFRNLEPVELHFSPKLNLFVGENAAGKTSLLEALFVLGRGRSFRTAKLDRLIQSDQDNFQLVARLVTDDGRHLPVGMRRSSGRFECRIGGHPVKRLSELAALLPIQWVGGNLHSLVEEGPAYRRQFLDWGLFHVKPDYMALWKRFNKLLKQRNAILRSAGTRREVQAWNPELAEVGEQLDRERHAYFDRLIVAFEQMNRELAVMSSQISVVYRRGWDKGTGFLDVLNAGFKSDIEARYTRSGPQRAELGFTADGSPAAERLSRGQQKMLVTMLQLAQAAVLREQTGKTSLFLLDDLGAELDVAHQRTVLTLLAKINAQVFVTAIVEPPAIDTITDAVMQFHVKQGLVSSLQ